MSERFLAAMVETGIRKQIVLELCVARRDTPQGLSGCGLLVINPPFPLLQEAEVVLPVLAASLGGKEGSYRIETLAGE